MTRDTQMYKRTKRMLLVIVIAVLAILSLSVFLTVQIGRKDTEDKRIINAFGRQRMYTQLIAKDASL